MNDEEFTEDYPEHTEYTGFGAAAPSPISGIGFRPTKVSKGGFVTDVEAYREDRR